MIGWFTGLSSLKMTLIASAATAAIVGSTAFIAGIRWEKADRYEDALKQIQLIETQATQSLNQLNVQWQTVAGQAKIDVQEWNLQNTTDTELFNRLIAGQADIRNQFDELENDIFITTDFGTCELSDAAIRLLRKAAATANAGMPKP